MRRKLTYFIAATTAALTFACSQASPTPTISPTSTPTIETVIVATPAPFPTPTPTPQHTATPTPDAAYQLKVSDTKNDIYAILKDAIGIQKRNILIASSIDEILASEKGQPYSPKDYHPLDEEILNVISPINDLKTLNAIKRVAIEINTIESKTEGIINNAHVIAVRNNNAVSGFSNSLRCDSGSLTPVSNPSEFRLPDYYESSDLTGSEVLSYMVSVLLTAKDLEEETARFNDRVEAREGYINNCRNYYLSWISGLSANTNTHQIWTAQVVSDNRAIAMQISDAATNKHSTGQVFLPTDFVDQKSPFHTWAYNLNFLEGIIARLEGINAVVTRTLDTAKDGKAITADTYEMLK
ncbi:hypothetical protein HYU12_05280, partial [Candidatus Woesearchaeota archaeon]|nr:hypothetical protein [Candidatus Woesearchaeota archaeon]